jgi:hypothetical protein
MHLQLCGIAVAVADGAEEHCAEAIIAATIARCCCGVLAKRPMVPDAGW